MIHDMWNISHLQEAFEFDFHVTVYFFPSFFFSFFTCVKCNKSWSVLTPGSAPVSWGLYVEQCRHQSVDV